VREAVSGAAAAGGRPTVWLSKLLQQTPVRTSLSATPSVTLSVLEEKDIYSPRFGLVLCWAVFPRSDVAVVVDDVRETGDSTAALYERRAKPDDLAIVNGGYYGLDGAGKRIPLGLVVSEGTRRNRRATLWKTGGVLTGSPLGILPLAKVSDTLDARYAVQSKPMLVEDGKLGIRSTQGDLANRSAVALTRSGDVIVAVAFMPSDQAATLYEFAEFLATDVKRGGPGADWALAMDGGPGAHAYFPAAARHCGSSGPNYVPNMVHVVRVSKGK